MGWVTFRETRSAKEYFTDKISSIEGFEMVDIAIVNFRTAYIAVKDLEKGYTYCLVYLLHRAPKDYYNFGYKDLSEFSGPCVYNCPKRIIDILTDLDEIKLHEPDWNIEFARNWREEVLAIHERNAKLKKATRKGCILKTEKPISFGNRSGSYEIQYFVKEGRKTFGIVNYGTQNEYKLQIKFRGFKNQNFEVIEK